MRQYYYDPPSQPEQNDPFDIFNRLISSVSEQTNPFDNFNRALNGMLVVSVILGIVSTVATVAVIYFIINCLKKAGTAIPSYARLANIDLEKSLLRPSSQEIAVGVASCGASQHQVETLPDKVGTIGRGLTRFSSRELAACTNDYADVLGSGGYGVVFKGMLEGGRPVAVKMLSNPHDKRIEDQFLAEVNSIESHRTKVERMLMVALLCIHCVPEKRPTMSTVMKLLEGDATIPRPEFPFEKDDTNKFSATDGSDWDTSGFKTKYSKGSPSGPVSGEQEIELVN
ncbi:hypothetical protein MLD38_029713 [Melastoma candidum]|uniref:Uncharacterized protein n=1 Tax=Melastoma candidum TaxID=119954 RepID=A0ACB9N4J0_9MYRT|nr:hypothetical protein MLD38_029713 [Melastoma candidum]